MKKILSTSYAFLFSFICLSQITVDQEIERVNNLLLDSITLEEIIDRAFENSPFLKSAAIEVERRALDIKKEKRSWLRELRFGFNFLDVSTSVNEQQQNVTTTSVLPNFGVSLTMSPETFVNRKTNIKDAKLNYQRFKRSLENERQNLKIQLITKYYNYLESLELHKIIEKSKENSIQQLLVIEERFKKGEIRIDAVLVAQKGLSDIEQALIKNFNRIKKLKKELEISING